MQPTLFDLAPLDLDRTFSRLERIQLDDTAWVDIAPGWVSGSDALFQTMVKRCPGRSGRAFSTSSTASSRGSPRAGTPSSVGHSSRP